MITIALPPPQAPQVTKIPLAGSRKLTIGIDDYFPDLSDTVDVTIDVPKNTHRDFLNLGKNVTLMTEDNFSLNKLKAGDSFRYFSKKSGTLSVKESTTLANNAKIQGNLITGSLKTGSNFKADSVFTRFITGLGNQIGISENLFALNDVTVGSINKLKSIFLFKAPDDEKTTRTLEFKSGASDIKPEIKLFLSGKFDRLNILAPDKNILNKLAIFTRENINSSWEKFYTEKTPKNIIRFFKTASM